MEELFRKATIDEIFSNGSLKNLSSQQSTYFVNEGLKSFDFDAAKQSIPTTMTTMSSGGIVFEPISKTRLAMNYVKNHWPVILGTAVIAAGVTWAIITYVNKERDDASKKAK